MQRVAALVHRRQIRLLFRLGQHRRNGRRGQVEVTHGRAGNVGHALLIRRSAGGQGKGTGEYQASFHEG
jgi:hypothetical protein